MKVLFADWSSWPKHKALQQRMKQTVTAAYVDARSVLLEIPADLTFIVQPHRYMANTDESAEFGSTPNDHLVMLLFDSGLPIPEVELLRNIRRRVFHELVFIVRYNRSLWSATDFLDDCLLEGLATAFVRDHANAGAPIWGQYEREEVKSLLEEVKTAATHNSFRKFDYMRRHPDGRRWIGIKVGTYLVDEAMKASGSPVEQLILMPMSNVRRLAGLPGA
jgi:predicted Zn-dependent protease DUF2268